MTDGELKQFRLVSEHMSGLSMREIDFIEALFLKYLREEPLTELQGGWLLSIADSIG